MKKNLPLLIPVFPYLLMTALIFFILPTLEPTSRYFSFLVLMIIPAYCFISAMIYGLKNGYVRFYPIFISIIFLPPIFLIIEIRALIYGGIFGVIALLGMSLGSFLKKRKGDNLDSEE